MSVVISPAKGIDFKIDVEDQFVITKRLNHDITQTLIVGTFTEATRLMMIECLERLQPFTRDATDRLREIYDTEPEEVLPNG